MVFLIYVIWSSFLQELIDQYGIAWIEYIIIFWKWFWHRIFMDLIFFAKLAKRGQLQIIPQKFSVPVRKFELNQLWRKVPTIFDYKKYMYNQKATSYTYWRALIRNLKNSLNDSVFKWLFKSVINSLVKFAFPCHSFAIFFLMTVPIIK